MLEGEYERGYDWFHQGESLLLLYLLTMANPARWAGRAVRFAELYVDPAHGNYDPARRIIRRPHDGSDPGRTGLFDGTHYPWLEQRHAVTASRSTGCCPTARPSQNAPGTRG